MDKEYLVNQLWNMASQYKLDISPEILGGIVNISLFRVVKKGEIGDDTRRAGFVLKGMIRCYYIDGNGNDVTRGFSIPGTFCMDEGMFGYRERLTEWEALEETALMSFDVREIIRNGNKIRSSQNENERARISLFLYRSEEPGIGTDRRCA